MGNYVKNEKGYSKIKFDVEAVKKAYSQKKNEKKFPTSISLSEGTVLELKSIATKKGIPYQTLMRMILLEGLEKLKKVA